MKDLFHFEVILPLISSIISLLMIVYFFLKGRKNKLFYSYIWCNILAFIWSFGQIFELLAYTVHQRWNSILFQYAGISFIALSWLYFCLSYTNNQFISKKRNVFLLVILPVCNYLAILTNNYHHQFYTYFTSKSQEYGVFFYLHTAVSILYLSIALISILRHFMRESGIVKKQAFALIFSGVLPSLGSIFYTFHLINLNFDPAPSIFSFSWLLVTLAIFRYRFLNIVPIALRKTMDNLKEAVVVVDDYQKIVDFNRAFIENIPYNSQIKINDDINSFIENLKGNIFNLDAATNIIKAIKGEFKTEYSGELVLNIPSRCCFIVNVRPISTKNQENLGRIISFYDITNYQNLLDDLNKKCMELSVMNERLKGYAATVAELAATKERNRLAKDVHDTLGQTMSLLIALLEVSSMACETNPSMAKAKILEALEITREGLNEIRQSVTGLSTDELTNNNLKASLNYLILQYQSAGMNVVTDLNGLERLKEPIVIGVIYKICKEALTNSLRHGKATKVNIILRVENNLIKLLIFDNGCGCKIIEKRMGLIGMEERVKNLNGTLVYGSDGESGFNITAEIPL